MEALPKDDENSHNNFKIINNAAQINILLMGKTGQGKSTILQMLKDPKKSVQNTRFSTTQDAYMETLAVLGPRNHSFHVIDTPGLFEVRSGEEKSRSNDELLHMAWKCLERSVTQLNAILLVFKYARLTQEDLHAVAVLKEFLRGSFPHNVVVIITGVEKLTSSPDKLKAILTDMGGEALQSLSEFCEGRFLFMGATPADMVGWLSSDKLEKLQNGITTMRQYFIDHIVKLPPCSLPPDLMTLYNDSLQELRSKMNTLKGVSNDYDEESKKQKQKIHEQVMLDKRKKGNNSKAIINDAKSPRHIISPLEDELKEVKNIQLEKSKQYTDKVSQERQILGLPEKTPLPEKTEPKAPETTVTWNLQDEVNTFSKLPENIYQVQTAIQKNILIIGKTGVGKSTLLKFLDDPNTITSGSSGYAQTETPQYHSRLLIDLKTNRAFNFNIIDTPGLFEVREKNEKKRATIEILDMIERCLKQSMTNIHAVFVVYRYDRGCTAEDLTAFDVLVEFLKEIVPNMGLILTHAEEIDEAKEHKTTEDIANSPQNKVLLSCKNRVYFTGLLDADALDWYDPSKLEELKNRTKTRHNRLINDIINEFTEEKELPNEIIKLHKLALENLKEKMKQPPPQPIQPPQTNTTPITVPIVQVPRQQARCVIS